jgi:hypothetical protein
LVECRGEHVQDIVTAEGVLRVIEHDEATVNGVLVPGWTGIGVEQPSAKPKE